MSNLTLNWKVAGAAGEGIKTTGMLFSKTCLRHGFFTFDYTEYPSLIRGGHNTYQVTASPSKVYSPQLALDLHLALNLNGLRLHCEEFSDKSAVVFDSVDLGINWSDLKLPGIPIDIPLAELAKSAGGQRVMLNNVALGASVFLLNLDITVLDAVIADTFGPKKTEVIKVNQHAAAAGYEFTKTHYSPLVKATWTKQPQVDTHTLTGNEAIALGLVAGGLKFYAAYPMTPSSSILHALADWQEKANIFVKHAEDEIGVINMSLGAAFAGVRAACGTSGGGFCYMTEAVGLSGIAELPLVIIDAQRPGPALGMPTWTAQGDLLFSLFASQDEFPRIVVAPGDVAEAFNLARLSLEWAENFQLPVILLTDKHLSESAESTHFTTTHFSVTQSSINPQPTPDETGYYPRYQLSPDGISPRSIPGQKAGFYMANSYEHDVHGLAIEDSDTRIAQMSKRMQKLKSLTKVVIPPYFVPKDDAVATLIGWGSTKNVLLFAQDLLAQNQIPVHVLNFSWLWPFPASQTASLLAGAVNPIIIEGNSQSQLAKLIRQETGIDIYHKRTKFDGRPIFPEEVVAWVKEIL